MPTHCTQPQSHSLLAGWAEGAVFRTGGYLSFLFFIFRGYTRDGVKRRNGRAAISEIETGFVPSIMLVTAHGIHSIAHRGNGGWVKNAFAGLCGNNAYRTALRKPILGGIKA